MAYYDVRVAQDQLAQSREDSEEKARKQAARIGYLVNSKNGERVSITFYNRSRDPITNVKFGFEDPGGYVNGVFHQDQMLRITQAGIYPCTKLTIALELVEELGRSVPPGYQSEKRDKSDTYHSYGISFTDVSGNSWTRDNNGDFGRADELRRWGETKSKLWDDGYFVSAPQERLLSEKAEHCTA
ncbi:hypothetical protein [Streptomyces sp. CS014]|uniref:hypothetical protein n=1 Tax=Streptomyces sp. CS014 TaxID=2162707 RepID=UPI0013A5700E|nr:hypothetical protein [Streptomyces sp. CS014]